MTDAENELRLTVQFSRRSLSIVESPMMSLVWTPDRKPPHPNGITAFSTEAEIIWKAICDKHEHNKQRRARPINTGLSYYQSMYNRAFRNTQSCGNTSTQHSRPSQIRHPVQPTPLSYREQELPTQSQVSLCSQSTSNESNQFKVHHPGEVHHLAQPKYSDSFSQPSYKQDNPHVYNYDSVTPETFLSTYNYGSNAYTRNQNDPFSLSSFDQQKNILGLHSNQSNLCTDYSQSLFSQTQGGSPNSHILTNRASSSDLLQSSPLLDLDNDLVLSQLPRLPPNDAEANEVMNPVHDYPELKSRKLQYGHGSMVNDIVNEKCNRSGGIKCAQFKEVNMRTSNTDILKKNKNGNSDTTEEDSPLIDGQCCTVTIDSHNLVKETTDNASKINTTFEEAMDVKDQSTSLTRIAMSTGKSDIRSFSELSTPRNTLLLRTPSSTIAARLRKLKNSFEATSKQPEDLQGSGHTNTGKIPIKQSKFSVPVKKAKELKEIRVSDCNDKSSHASCRLVDVGKLSDAQRQQLAGDLHQANEVALTLVYQDGSSQLREIIDMKKKGNATESKPVLVAIAYPVSGSLQYVAMTLPKTDGSVDKDTEIMHWTKSTLSELMRSKTRKLAFDSQELVETLLVTFKYDHRKVVRDWTVMDAKIASWLLDPDHPPVTFKLVLDTVPDYRHAQISSSTQDVCQDLDMLGPVMLHLYHQLTDQGLWKLYTQIETPLSPILACMQHRGLTINTASMIQAGEWMKKKLKQLEKQAFLVAGHSFLINSHAQLRQVLFEELKLDEKLPGRNRIARTASNQHKSTSEAVLTQLSTVHALPAIILEYRQIQKVKSTYVDGLLPCVKSSTLYTHWDQTAAVTGRLTSTNPNIQAIPKQPLVLQGVRDNYVIDKEDTPVEILSREPFVAKTGWSFVAADFQQIELRLLSHLSADASLLAIFNQAQSTDIFVQLTAQWTGKSLDDVTTSEREQTKRVVYSVMYGVGKERLADYLKISPDHAKSIMTSFLVRFPGINSFTKKCIVEARNKGYQCTIFGRRRWFPQINHSNPGLRAQAERQAVNFCIQGSAADLCKAAMIQLEHTLADKPQLATRMLVQIHDELLMEVPDKEIPEIIDILRGIMERRDGLCGSSVSLSVPITVSFTQGKSWGHMESCP